MDPKSLNTIDPKLRETYERVMGTSSPTPQVTTAPPAQTPVTPTPIESSPTPMASEPPPMPPTPDMTSMNIPSGVPETPQESPNQTNQPAYQKDNLQFQASIQSPFGTSFSSTTPTEPAPATPKPASSTIRILYIVGAIVFFIAYTFFWVKVFNLPTPF